MTCAREAISKDNDYMKTTENGSRFFRTLLCLSMESISFELTMLISSIISMILFVHNDFTRDEVPRLR